MTRSFLLVAIFMLTLMPVSVPADAKAPRPPEGFNIVPAAPGSNYEKLPGVYRGYLSGIAGDGGVLRNFRPEVVLAVEQIFPDNETGAKAQVCHCWETGGVTSSGFRRFTANLATQSDGSIVVSWEKLVNGSEWRYYTFILRQDGKMTARISAHALLMTAEMERETKTN
jgi:hypothetical protein